jgi:hypothetical protein
MPVASTGEFQVALQSAADHCRKVQEQASAEQACVCCVIAFGNVMLVVALCLESA